MSEPRDGRRGQLPARSACLVALAMLGLALLSPVADAEVQELPVNGRAVLEAMRAAYAGRWFTTLTFVQKTRKQTPDGMETVETWYESLRHTEAAGTQLRIDIGPPVEGNRVVYSAGETQIYRAGKRVAVRKGGNALLPLIAGVYLQPVGQTVGELQPTGVDFARSTVRGWWEDRPVWLVGAASAQDTTSAQFWVDVERKVVVRAIFVPVPGAPVMDIRLGRMVPLGGSWLATHCEFFVDGKLVQVEDYQDWKAGVELPAALFEHG